MKKEIRKSYVVIYITKNSCLRNNQKIKLNLNLNNNLVIGRFHSKIQIFLSLIIVKKNGHLRQISFSRVEFKSPMSISHILFVYKTFLDKTDARRFELLVLKRTPRLKPGTLNHSVTHPLKLDWCNMYNYRHGTRTHNGRNQCFYRAPPLPVRNICIMNIIPRP